jgi:hypothetical protein
MKKLALAILPVILFSCTNKSGNSSNKEIPISYRQYTYLLDTIADIYVYEELRNVSEVILNEEGEVKSAVQTNFSFKNMEGSKEESINIYSPIVHWSYLHQSEQDSITSLIKYYKKSLKDTLLKDGEYAFQYDKNSRLILFAQAYASSSPPFLIFDFQYDQQGRWTQITKHFREERSGHFSSEITIREFPENNKPLDKIYTTYMTVNGESLIDKGVKTIVDYYVLLKKAAIFVPDNDGGKFDVPNGYFEYSDDGTGAGEATSQIALFKTNEGKDLLAINGYYMDPGSSYPITSGHPPTFYSFDNKSFTELANIFPDVNINLFFDRDTGSVEGIPFYFTLPQKGTSIQCNFGIPINFLRENYNNYKELCDTYSGIKRTSFTLEFDRIIPGFYVKN